MRVLIGGFGTRGDVQPMVALARTLIARGHSVRVAVPPSSFEFARGFGLDCLSVGVSYEEMMRRAVVGSVRELMTIMPLVRAEIGAQLHALETEAEQADVIAGSSVFMIGSLLSAKLRRPYAFFSFCPQMIPSANHPAPGIRWQTLPRWINRFSWVLNAVAWRVVLRKTLRQVWAARGLEFTGDPWRSLMGRLPLVASDPALALAPADYEVPLTQTGALFLDDLGELSPALSAFLEAGPPPVYVGFGSMADRDPKATTLRLLESVRRAGARAVVARGWAGLGAEQASDGVLFVGPEPHGKLFPRCAAVVHHGGAGTTHAAARAGVPQVVMPQLLDQFYWAHQLRRLGVGPARVPRHAANPEPLAAALRECLGNPVVEAKARALAASMRTDGAVVAAEHLERVAKS